MIRSVMVSFLFAISVPTHAEQVPGAVIDSCLLFQKSTDASVSIAPIEGATQLTDDVTVPGYQLFTPAGDNNTLRVGYAISERGNNDYVFVGTRRGYIVRAVAVGKFKPARVETPSLASFAVLRQHGRRYVCVMESNGNGSAAFVRSAFVGRISSSKGSTLNLFYKVADVKKFAAFNDSGR